MSRFDYVKYDEEAVQIQNNFKDDVTQIETHIRMQLKSQRAVAIALTKLEEFYMWIGKAIRDDQIARNGSAELQEEHNNS